LPELIDQKKQRYLDEYSLPNHDVEILTSSKKIADLFENTISYGCAPKEVSNWIMGDLMKFLKENQMETDEIEIKPGSFARMIELLKAGKINRNAAKTVFSQLLSVDINVDAYVKENNLIMIADSEGLVKCVLEVLANNQQSVSDYKAGKDKAFLYLVGQVMRQMKGKADPMTVNSVLKEEIEK